MNKRMVRIENITLENFKNVKKGSLDLINKKTEYKASIVGLYGQNGSGKTAIIDALNILKHVICSKSLPGKYADYINVEADCATLSFQFAMSSDEEEYKIWYQFSLVRALDHNSTEENSYQTKEAYTVEVVDEVLSYSKTSETEKIRKSLLIDTRTESVFVPLKKYKELLGESKEEPLKMLITKGVIRAQSRSFIFSRELMSRFREFCAIKTYLDVIEGIHSFGTKELFVINTEQIGMVSMSALPLSFKYKDKDSEAFGNLMLPLHVPAVIPENAVVIVQKIISSMNIVLEQLVPGLTIGVELLDNVALVDGKPGRRVQFKSLKNNKEIPFQYESEGIKKIVSILQLLIVVYNNPSITVAIDELDSGIFEYLLGELLKIISEKGKGQLIFTSHNLRPLERIDKGFIAFTTVNPENRYIRMTNVKGNNNLRDFYYRDIVLGGQNEQVYNVTNNFDIALAFREAGGLLDA